MICKLKKREKKIKKLHKSARRPHVSHTSHLKKKMSVFRGKFEVRPSSACVLIPACECTQMAPAETPGFGWDLFLDLDNQVNAPKKKKKPMEIFPHPRQHL